MDVSADLHLCPSTGVKRDSSFTWASINMRAQPRGTGRSCVCAVDLPQPRSVWVAGILISKAAYLGNP